MAEEDKNSAFRAANAEQWVQQPGSAGDDGDAFGFDAPPPPYYSLANPAFVQQTGGFQVGSKLEAIDVTGSGEAGKQLICVATIKAAEPGRVLISFDGVRYALPMFIYIYIIYIPLAFLSLLSVTVVCYCCLLLLSILPL